MNLFEALTAIVRYLLIFAGGMAVLTVATVFMITGLPADNPLKRILTALSVRLAVTVGAGIVAIPAETIPGVDVVYSLAAPIALLCLWATLLRAVRAIQRESRRSAAITARFVDEYPPSRPDTETSDEPPRLSP